MKKLILIDANALVHRAFHALPLLTSPQGQVVNAAYGFTSILLKTIKDLKPDYIAAAFDLAGPTFRHEEFEEYKAHRPKAPDELYAQIPLVKQVLKVFGIEVFEKEGFEADDLIGSVAEQTKKTEDLQTIILTGDLDTLQLVEGDHVVVLTLRKGVSDTVLYNEETVKERYGLEPYQIIDFKGLKGDPSDNIPGVPGIGEKTATALLQKYSTIENLYKGLRKIKNFKKAKSQTKKSETKSLTIKPLNGNSEWSEVLTAKLAEKLKNNEKQALFSKRLATIIRDVDVDFSTEKISWQDKFNKMEVANLLRSFGFNSLLNRLPELSGGSQKKQDSLNLPEEILKKKTEGKVKEVKTQREVDEILAISAKTKKVYLFWSNGRILFLFDGGTDIFSVREKLLPKLRPIFESKQTAKRGHDLKPLLKVLLKSKIHVQNIDFDSALAAYLIKPDFKDYSLDKVYFLEFGQPLGSGVEEQTLALPKLAESLWERLRSRNLTKVFKNIDLPVTRVLAEMETTGIKIDTAGLKSLSEKVNGETAKLEKKVYSLAGKEFNINSPQQLSAILFDKLLLKTKVKKTGGGALSTAASELEKLSEEHPIVGLIMHYRELQKLKTTYIDPFPSLIDPTDGRLHTTYNQTGTVTGRLSSQDPNLQNIPVRTELGQEFRRAFVAEDGYELISFDYSQIELRIAAHLSGDEKMKEAFYKREDIHARTAAEVFDMPIDRVTSEMRREAKALNFGLLFGMGVTGFARSAGVDRMKAREFVTRYLKKFSGMAAYIEKVKKEAREKGFVQTYFGRRRELPEINSSMPQLAAQAERMAVNAPIQGTESDIMKIAMTGVFDFIHENGLDVEARILLQVHDELLCEMREEKIRQLAPRFKKIMEDVWKADVPIVVDVKVGKNWSSQCRYCLS